MIEAKENISMRSQENILKSGIDLSILYEKLFVCSSGSQHNRDKILAIFQSTLDEAKNSVKNRFQSGLLSGLETAKLISQIHDDIIKTLFDYTMKEIAETSESGNILSITLCAVGGYGRGEMAPESDVDLLFLTANQKDLLSANIVTEYMLYMLWDLGIKVGYSTRTSSESIKLAREDQTILTALLDLRYLCGEKELALELTRKFRKSVARGKGRAYIAIKLAERDARHEKAGNSRYMIEPNVKEGKGGLRDLHSLYWIARFLDRDDKVNDAQNPQSYVDLGLFEKASATRFVRAADFLWRARIWLHYISGRPNESLSFDKQTVLARKMGYASGPVEIAVEKFMKEYFINAREVGALTRIACAKLEAQKSILLPKGLDVFLPNSRRNIKNTDFVLDHGRLMFSDPLKIKKNPSMILQLFETAGRRNLDIHPDAFSAIDFRRNLIDGEFRRDPINSKIFMKILSSAKSPYSTLKAMNEAGVLGRYLIEFGGIVARTQFNMHHAYTVDEHTLRLIENFDNILMGKMEKEHPVSTKIVKNFTKEQVTILYLACLLHDTGKGQGDQCIEGAQLGRRACRRLGVGQDITDTVAWLIRRHLDMSETAQRRDISDTDTIKEFAELVGSQERLDMITVLTTVDIRAVGPGIWNDWKGALLQSLYYSTEMYLKGREELAPVSRATAAKEMLNDKLSSGMAKRIAPIINDLDVSYWLNFDMTDLIRHARFFDQNLDSNGYTFVQTRRDRTRDITELWIMTKDRSKLFADITRSISASGASIIGARLHTGKNDRVMNVFYLQNSDGQAFGRQSDHALEVLRMKAFKGANGNVQDMKIPRAIMSTRAGAIPIVPSVNFFNTASSNIMIIEVTAKDRPGLLYDIAEIFIDEYIDVLSAHIEVEGTKAIDVFYVKSCGLENIISDCHQQQLNSMLIKALSSDTINEKVA